MLNQKRMEGLFPSNKLGVLSPTFVGVGALGSWTTLMTAKLIGGGTTISIMDSDKVEEHNLCNQVYGMDDVGCNKAVAMKALLLNQCAMDDDTDIVTSGHYEFGGELGNVVFSCLDSMSARRLVFDGCADGTVMFESRLGVRHGQIYIVQKGDKASEDYWLEHWDEDGTIKFETSACGTRLTVGHIAALLGSLTTQLFMDYLNGKELPRSITACVEPYTIIED